MNHNVTGWVTGRRVRELAALGQRRVALALDAIEDAGRIEADMRDLARSRSAAAPRSGGRTTGGRRLRFVAVGLTVLNAAAVVLVLTVPDKAHAGAGGSEIGVAVLLGVSLAGGQLALAVALGRRLQGARHTAEVASRAQGRVRERGLPLEAAGLGLLCALVGWAIYLWTHGRVSADHAALGMMVGAALAVEACVAPWLLVSEIAGTRPGELRRFDILDRRIEDLAVAWEADRSTASLALITARSTLHKAARTVARTAELSGQPVRASWSHALRQLGDAIAEAEARYARLVSGAADDQPGTPKGRDDVDLVG